MATYRSLNQTKWHCQYHVVFIPKYRKKAIYGGLREQLGEVLRQRPASRESGRGRASAGGPCPHAGVDSREVLGGAGGRLSQGEARDPHRPRIFGSVPELRGAALLGAGVLRLDRGSRRASDSRIYPAAGTRRSAAGSVADGLEEAALSGSQTKAPGFAGGYLFYHDAQCEALGRPWKRPPARNRGQLQGCSGSANTNSVLPALVVVTSGVSRRNPVPCVSPPAPMARYCRPSTL